MGRSGEPGSFLTKILGAALPDAFRELEKKREVSQIPSWRRRTPRHVKTYALEGEDFVGCAPLVGLPLPLRGADMEAFGVPEGRAVRGTEGDEVEGAPALLLLAGANSAYAGRS